MTFLYFLHSLDAFGKSKFKEHDDQIVRIIQVINQLITPLETSKKKIGFTIE